MPGQRNLALSHSQPNILNRAISECSCYRKGHLQKRAAKNVVPSFIKRDSIFEPKMFGRTEFFGGVRRLLLIGIAFWSLPKGTSLTRPITRMTSVGQAMKEDNVENKQTCIPDNAADPNCIEHIGFLETSGTWSNVSWYRVVYRDDERVKIRVRRSAHFGRLKHNGQCGPVCRYADMHREEDTYRYRRKW